MQKTPLKDHKHFLYTVYKQQYLELIEQHEHQKVLFLPSAFQDKRLWGHAANMPDGLSVS